MTHSVTVTVLLSVGVVLGIAGPFGTSVSLTLPARLAYWLCIVCVTYGWGLALGLWLAPKVAQRPFWQRVGLQGIGSALGVCLAVLALNRAVFGIWPAASEVPVFLATLVSITVIVSAVLEMLEVHREKAPAVRDQGLPRDLPPLLDRLPLDKRGPLVALSVEDHYVRIRTTRGQEMILMRLSDAMREVGQTPGAQVHRSHWVAFEHVAAAEKVGDRAILTLRDGAEIPVSRANLPKIREAGLLPR
ncbi:LytTR family DNA-binding domain-containing protein [Mesobacterium sp. TK19101]|uniref:LytTR family DNA-binding domain-containing protein n=1 Tax=Mesobacterium hydrothermale TaxID=3111907 RepID=A0ABU6HEM7_9RHOB|nr:LytTR family DNA-binding domain-containing protein [Mesobacterium sp. TK19101]MEC3860305.1 LytTR family DNA-binding domain-containing protein [Mesobacterium sp. TK19101]